MPSIAVIEAFDRYWSRAAWHSTPWWSARDDIDAACVQLANRGASTTERLVQLSAGS